MAENNNNQIGILFGVEGGVDINGASGAKIAEQLQKIASKLDGKIKFVASLDKTKTRKAILDQLKDIQSDIKLGLPEIDKKSTDKAVSNFRSISKKLGSAMADLTELGGASFKSKNAFLLDTQMKAFQGSSQEVLTQVRKFQADYQKVTDDINKLQIGGQFNVNKDNFAEANQIYQRFEDLKIEAKQLRALNSNIQATQKSDLSHLKVLDSVTKYLQKYGDVMSKNTPGSYQKMIELSDKLKDGAFVGRGGAAQQEFLDIVTNARLAGGEVETLGQKVKRVFDEKLGYGVLATLALYARQSIIQVYNNVVNLDTAITELKKVTDETDATYNKFLDDAAERAQKLGATMSDVVTASADFARLGYQLDDASELADAAIVYKNVGDGISDISEASESIISTMKAYGIEASDAMSIVDRYNEVGNRFAISSKGVGEVLLRSASALATANNTLDESIALGTAANSVVQDPEKVGTSLKTISMYLRSAKTDLEDAGESVDGLVESTPKLQSLLKNVAGIDILQADGQTFKSTYQILKELSAVWDNLTDVNQASVLEAIGGKRNANVTSALIKNFSEAEKVLATAQNSSGSALSENEKYLDSINGKISQLKAQFEDMSRQVLSSDTVKWTADLLQNALKLVDTLSKAKVLLPGIISLLTTKSGLGVFGTNKLGQSTLFGTTKEQRAKNKYLGTVTDQSTFFGIRSPILDITSDDLKALKAFNAEIISGTSGQEAFNNHLAKSSDYVQNLGEKLKEGTLSMQQIEAATTGASTAMTIFNTIKAAALNFGISFAIQGIVMLAQWIAKSIPTAKNLGEKLSEINQELSSLKSESESLNSELQTTADRIAELESQGSLTLVEENELAKLKQENAELERQIQLKKDLIEKKIREQKETFSKYVKTQHLTDDTLYGTSKVNAYNNQISNLENEKNNITRQYQSRKIDFNTYDIELRKIDATIEGIQQKIINITDIRRSTEVGAILDILDNAKAGTEEYNDALEDLLDVANGYEEKIQGLYDNGYTYGADEKTDAYIDQLNEVIDIYNKYKGNFDELWKSLINRPKFVEAKRAIDELGEGFNSTQLFNLMQTNEAVQTLVEYLSRLGLIDWQKILGASFSEADKDANGYLDTSEMLALSQKDLENALSSVANQFSDVSKKTEEATEKMSDYLEATKSLTDSFKDIDSKKSAIADMLAELRDDGKLSTGSYSTLFDDFSSVEGFENYIKVLTSSKSSTKQMQDALNGLYGAYIDSKGILDNVTEETLDYATAQLKALGVTNSADVATLALATTLTNAAIKKKEFNEETAQSIKQQMLEKGASETVANQYIQTARVCIEAQSKLTQEQGSQTAKRVANMGIELTAIKSVADAHSQMLSKMKSSLGLTGVSTVMNQFSTLGQMKEYFNSKFGEGMWEYLEGYGKQAQVATDALTTLNNLKNQISKTGSGGFNISVSPTADSGSLKTPEDLHKEAFDDWYANLKYRRDNNIISETQYLQELDDKYRRHFDDRSKYLEEYAKYSQEVYEGFKKLYQDDLKARLDAQKEALNAQKEALEEQKDDLKELADARKQALDDAKDEDDYNKEQSEKREEINKLKVLIASFRGTLSLSSQKKLRELQQQLKEKEEELADFESDKALERAKDQIDKEYESQEESINAQIKNVETQIKGVEEQLEQINDDLPAIREAVIGFARQYGVPITRAYARGTSSVPAITQENGAEIIAGNVKSGQFTMLTPTSKVWNASATQALWEFANSPAGYISSVMDKISSFKQKAMSMVYSQPVNVNVGGITVNGNADNKTVEQIRRNQKGQIEEMLKGLKKLQ